jgi:hypothetical protein
VEAIRAGRSPKDGKLGALWTLARTLIETRGRIDDQLAEQFLATGFGMDHLLEVIAVVAASTITNWMDSRCLGVRHGPGGLADRSAAYLISVPARAPPNSSRIL